MTFNDPSRRGRNLRRLKSPIAVGRTLSLRINSRWTRQACLTSESASRTSTSRNATKELRLLGVWLAFTCVLPHSRARAFVHLPAVVSSWVSHQHAALKTRGEKSLVAAGLDCKWEAVNAGAKCSWSCVFHTCFKRLHYMTRSDNDPSIRRRNEKQNGKLKLLVTGKYRWRWPLCHFVVERRQS